MLMVCWTDDTYTCVIVTGLQTVQQMAATAELRSALEGFEREADDGSIITLHQFELASLANLMQVSYNAASINAQRRLH